MCDLMVRGERIYEIRDGLVLSHSRSGGDTFCWALTDFRRMCVDGPELLREFDAEAQVLMFRREH